MSRQHYSSTGCRAELRRLAKYKSQITPQEMRTLRGQIKAGDIDAAWRMAQANRTILEVFAAAYLREQRRCAEARERRMRGEAIRPDYAGD